MSEQTETQIDPSISESSLKQLVILPCPHCGGEKTGYGDGDDCGFIYCIKCNATVSLWYDELPNYDDTINECGDETKLPLIDAWNKRVSSWSPIESAPKDGTPVLLKFKNDLSKYTMGKWDGLVFVGRSRDDTMEWGFAAPVGCGGFPDAWLEGWKPINEAI